MNVDDVYKRYEIWFSSNLNSSVNKQLAWSCFLAGFLLSHEPQAQQVPVDEARINKLEIWQGNNRTARFTVQQVSLQFLVNLELFYAVQDNLLCQSVGFFYDRQHADIAAQALEQTIGKPAVLDIERLAEILCQ